MSLGESILSKYAAKNLPVVPAPVFGESLHAWRWSARIRSIWEAVIFEKDGETRKVRTEVWLAATVALSLVDDDCKLVFQPYDPAEEMSMTFDQVVDAWSGAAHRLAEVDYDELTKAYDITAKLNKLPIDEVKEAEKNSALAPSISSPTGSPS